MAIRRQHTEVFVGLFLFFGLIIMGALVLQYGRIQEKFKDHYSLQMDLPDASGIRKGVPVRLAGSDVGYVANEPVLKTDFSGLRLNLKIYTERKIPRQSTFTVGTNGLMGDTFIRIVLPEKHDGQYFKPNDLIIGNPRSDLNDMQHNAESMLKEVSFAISEIHKTVKGLDSLFGRIESDVMADENLANLKSMLAELRESSQNINQATKKLDPILANTNSIIQDAKKSAGKIDGLLSDTQMAMKEVTVAMKDIQTTTAAADPILAELRSVLQQADRTIGKIENGNGLAAALVNDSGLRRDVESLVGKLDRNGVLFYPREKKPKPAKLAPANTEPKKKPFQWLKPKNKR